MATAKHQVSLGTAQFSNPFINKGKLILLTTVITFFSLVVYKICFERMKQFYSLLLSYRSKVDLNS